MPILVVAAVIHRYHDPEKRILIVRRGPDQTGAGAWEFPGGKVEMGESPEQALLREIDEELGIKIRIQSLVGEADHSYPNKVIRLRVYRAETDHDELQLTEHDAHRWCLLNEINLEELSAADRPFIQMLLGK